MFIRWEVILMDEKNTAQPTPPVFEASVPPTASAGPVPVSAGYASFFERFVAAIIDSLIVSFVTGILAGGLGGFREGSYSVTYGSFGLLGVAYYVFMLYKYGATFGKQVMKIRVQSISTGEKLTLGEAAVREIVGKFLSSIVFCLGYFWMIWDGQKQTWHDKLVKSVVVKTQ